LNGKICNGNGACNCSGCNCTYPFTGTNCDCKVCKGNCFGNGVCNCNGTCTCLPGFDPNFDCYCPLNCLKSANGLECSGNGKCDCGVCKCFDGFLGQTCDCKDPALCPTATFGDECSGNGKCNCNGTCDCDDGYTGPDCNTPIPCDGNACENCSLSTDPKNPSKPFCLWCSITKTCVNTYSKNLNKPGQGSSPCNLGKPNNAKDPSVFKNATDCPVAEVPIVDEVKPEDKSVAIGIGVAAGAAVILAGITAILLAVNAKKADGLLESEGFLNNNGAGSIKNPLFESGSKTYTSQIYLGNN